MLSKTAPVDGKGEVVEFTGPVAGYELMEPKPAAPDDRFIASTIDASPEVAHAVAEAHARYAAALLAPAEGVGTDQDEEQETPAEPPKINIGVVIGVGVLAFVAFLASFLLHGKTDSSGDMGTVNASSGELKGHLTATWGDRLNYKLTLEPADPGQAAAFANAVYHSPKPIWVGLQLKDPTGTVLCANTILLKFDPLQNNPAAGAASASGETGVNREDVAQALNNARLESQEIAREHGKDLFENVNGPDGQVASIASQGTLPCTKKQYDGTASWAFISNFPALGAALAAPTQEADRTTADDAQDRTAAADAQRSLARKRKAAAQVSNFSIEEDDEIVGYRSAAGTIETLAGKTFRVEKKDATMSALKGMDLPVRIHYRCDQFGTCTLAGAGSEAQHAWMVK